MQLKVVEIERVAEDVSPFLLQAASGATSSALCAGSTSSSRSWLTKGFTQSFAVAIVGLTLRPVVSEVFCRTWAGKWKTVPLGH